jgi:hypothetical protein
MSGFEPPQTGFAIIERPGNGLAVAALVLGLVAIALFCVPYVSFPCSILAIVFGVIGRKRAAGGARNGGLAAAGLVLGIIAIVLIAVALAGMLAVLGLGNAGALEALNRMATSVPASGH